jgi:hypothetical protein
MRSTTSVLMTVPAMGTVSCFSTERLCLTAREALQAPQRAYLVNVVELEFEHTARLCSMCVSLKYAHSSRRLNDRIANASATAA